MNNNPNPKISPESLRPNLEPDTPKRVIAPDEDFEKLIDDNAEKAWLKYCELNGLDPNSSKEV